jgi:hypothetical protein
MKEAGQRHSGQGGGFGQEGRLDLSDKYVSANIEKRIDLAAWKFDVGAQCS